MTEGQPEPQAQQLRLLIEQMPAIVWTVDEAERFTSVVGGGIAALGVRSSSIHVDTSAGPGWADVLEPTLAAHRLALAGEHSRYQASWGERIFECSVEPLRAEGRIMGSIGVAVDVTEKLRAEDEMLDAFKEGVDCMVRAIESRDIANARHVERMSAYCFALSRAAGLDPGEARAIAIAARLHDIGKIGIPDALLLKEDPLCPEEQAAIERHCRVGHQILVGARSEILQVAAVIALTHHEWFDGTGYPQGLLGEAIPFVGRIAAIADVFDALTTDRPYRTALTFGEALDTMREERGSHFDPGLLDLFFELEPSLLCPEVPKQPAPRLVARTDPPARNGKPHSYPLPRLTWGP